MWQTMITMYKTEGGFTALYRGIVPTVAGVAPYVRVNCNALGGAGRGLTETEGRSKLYDIRVCTAILNTGW